MSEARISRIKSIIDQRRPLAAKIEAAESSIYQLASALQKVEKHRAQLISKIDDIGAQSLLQEVELTTIQGDINAELSALSKLKARFSRRTLNIGVVGRAGQGKSRLLQSLSGLSTEEIPSGDRSHCTGVRSTIHHNPNVDTYGEVWFHSERSFLDA